MPIPYGLALAWFNLLSGLILNLTLTVVVARNSLYDRSAPIYTQPRYLPPSKVQGSDISQSVIGEGCIIKVRADVISLLIPIV